MSAGNSSFCIAANLIISWKTRISQQAVPVPLLCVLSCTYDDSGAYIKLCEPMMTCKEIMGIGLLKCHKNRAYIL